MTPPPRRKTRAAGAGNYYCSVRTTTRFVRRLCDATRHDTPSTTRTPCCCKLVTNNALSFGVPPDPPRSLPRTHAHNTQHVDSLGLVGEFGFIRDEVKLGLVPLRRLGIEGEPLVVSEKVVYDVVETRVLALDGVVLLYGISAHENMQGQIPHDMKKMICQSSKTSSTCPMSRMPVEHTGFLQAMGRGEGGGGGRLISSQ